MACLYLPITINFQCDAKFPLYLWQRFPSATRKKGKRNKNRNKVDKKRFLSMHDIFDRSRNSSRNASHIDRESITRSLNKSRRFGPHNAHFLFPKRLRHIYKTRKFFNSGCRPFDLELSDRKKVFQCGVKNNCDASIRFLHEKAVILLLKNYVVAHVVNILWPN